MIHEDIQLTGSFQASGSFNAPLHAGTGSALEETGSIFNDTTDNFLKIYDGNNWLIVGENTASLLIAAADIEYLVVAGGGGGGGTIAGGGGAGGLLSSSLSSVESGSSITVTVGGGGTGGYGWSVYTPATQGQNSSIASSTGTSFSTVTSIGGGKGGDHYGNSSANNLPGDGGSGGGGGRSTSYPQAGGSATTGQGNDGGSVANSSAGDNYGSGGGGAGAAGTTAGADADGGVGKQSSITGTSTYYAGGGGGGTRQNISTDVGEGGLGGGGAGDTAQSATAGTANTGGGGGGAGYTTSTSAKTGGDGGSGVVILAYDSGSINAAGGIVGDAGNGRKYNQFNASDTFKVGSTSDFQIVTSGLVGHWDAANFSSRGTSTWSDLTSNGKNQTAVGSPTLNNYYYDFNGTNQYFQHDDNTNGFYTFTNLTYSVEIWYKSDSFSSENSLISKRDSGNPGDRNWMLLVDTSATVRWYGYQNDSTGQNAPANTTLSTGTWYHLIVTLGGSGGNYTYYNNGSSDGSGALTITSISSDQSWLEFGRRGTNSGHNYLNGQIAQVRLYNKELSAAEVLQNYNATKTNFV